MINKKIISHKSLLHNTQDLNHFLKSADFEFFEFHFRTLPKEPVTCYLFHEKGR